MKTIKHIITFVLILTLSLIVTSCKKENTLDLKTYYNNSATYKVYNVKDSGKMDIGYLINNEPLMDSYTVIQLTSNKNWTNGLIINYIEFDITLSEIINLDIDISITNLANAEHYNKSTDEKFYKTTLSINQLSTHIKLDINDTLENKNSVISIEINESCYKSNPNFTLGISNLKISAYHEQTNY